MRDTREPARTVTDPHQSSRLRSRKSKPLLVTVVLVPSPPPAKKMQLHKITHRKEKEIEIKRSGDDYTLRCRHHCLPFFLFLADQIFFRSYT